MAYNYADHHLRSSASVSYHFETDLERVLSIFGALNVHFNVRENEKKKTFISFKITFNIMLRVKQYLSELIFNRFHKLKLFMSELHP